MKNSEIRSFENDLVNVLNAYEFPFEFKRIALEKLARQCELKAIEEMASEPVTEEGELNGSELDKGSRCE